MEFRFLDDKYNRPVCNCIVNGEMLRCMFDTGAGIPVFCRKSIVRKFSDNCKCIGRYSFGGFGNGKMNSPVYQFNNFLFGMSVDCAVSYSNIAVFSCDRRDLGCDLIVSSSMFTECIVTVDYLNRFVYVQSQKDKYTFSVSPDLVPYVCTQNTKLRRNINH